jgi:ATP-dependent DNA helicase RecQ
LGSTSYGISLELLQQGLSLEQIAEKRSLALGTVYSHMALLYEEGADVPILRFINKNEIKSVAKIISKMEEVDKLKPIYEALNGEIEYNKIRLILAYLKKNGELASPK